MDIKVMNYKLGPIVVIVTVFLLSRALISVFTITAEIHARSLANLYCQYADRHMNLN